MQYLNNFQVNFGYLIDAIVAFAPLLIAGSLFALLISRFLGGSGERTEIFFQMIFSGLVGCSVAYIQIGVGDIIGQILPPVLVTLTVLFQLVGRVKPNLSAPMDSSRAFASTGMAFGSFLLSAQYIAKAITFN